tara:strand:+ start:770 stop:1249 length:480 start_codon:yes stop_codon:yes gene_type:complete
MKKSNPTHTSSLDDLEAWINDDSKKCSSKNKEKLDKQLKENKEKEIQKKEDEKKIKKESKKMINDKYSKKNDPLYGKKGAERRHIIEEYRKQYKQAQLMKSNKNDTPNSEVGMPSNEMIETMMNKIKASGQDPEEIMKKLNNPDYPEELKSQLVQDIFK